MECEAELVAADEDGAAPELAQEAQHGEVVVGLHGVSHDRAKPLKGVAVGGEVAEDLRLAVEVEGTPLCCRHHILHPHPLAVQVAVGATPEAVLRGLSRRRRRLWLRGRGGRGYGSAQGQEAVAASKGDDGRAATVRVAGLGRV